LNLIFVPLPIKELIKDLKGRYVSGDKHHYFIISLKIKWFKQVASYTSYIFLNKVKVGI